MGTVTRGSKMRKFFSTVAMVALLVPGIGKADTLSYPAPYQGIHQGGDASSNLSGSKDTGDLRIVQSSLLAASSVSGSLGCVGRGGFIELEQQVATGGEIVATIEADYSQAVVSPFGFIKIAVRKGGVPLEAEVVRGPLAGDGTISLTLTNLAGEPTPVAGPLDVWFGVEVSSSCPPSPPLEVSKAIFTQLRAVTV